MMMMMSMWPFYQCDRNQYEYISFYWLLTNTNIDMKSSYSQPLFMPEIEMFVMLITSTTIFYYFPIMILRTIEKVHYLLRMKLLV